MKKRLTMFLAALFLTMGTALAQTKVSGTVLSQEDGQPIIGAAVKVVGTSTGMLTDVNGRFSIAVPAGKNEIEVSYLGFESQILPVKNGMRVFLKSDAQLVDEVVVVAYGTAKRQSITGSVASIDSKEIEKRIGRAEYELTFAEKFDTVIINDDLEKAKEETLKKIQAFL